LGLKFGYKDKIKINNIIASKLLNDIMRVSNEAKVKNIGDVGIIVGVNGDLRLFAI